MYITADSGRGRRAFQREEMKPKFSAKVQRNAIAFCSQVMRQMAYFHFRKIILTTLLKMGCKKAGDSETYSKPVTLQQK